MNQTNQKMSKIKFIAAKKLSAVLKEYQYAILDRRNFDVKISFSEKRMTTDEGYSDYDQTMNLVINSISSMWGSETNIEITMEIPFHVTNNGDTQQGEVSNCLVYVWGTRESFEKRLYKAAGINEDNSWVDEVPMGKERTSMFFSQASTSAAVCRYLQKTYVAPALAKFTFNNFAG